MSRRRKLLFWLAPLAVLVLFVALLLNSGWGVSLGLQIASAVIPGELSAREHDGNLLGPLHLRGLRYQHERVTVTVAALDLSWHSLGLLSGKLDITQLDLHDVDIAVHGKPGGGSTQRATVLLPLRLNVQQFSLDKLKITPATNARPILIDHIELSGEGSGQTIALREFAIAAYQARVRANGTLSLADHFPLDLTIAASYQLDASRRIDSRGTVHGDMRKLRVLQDLSGPVQARLTAEATDLVSRLQWQGQLDIASLDPKKLHARAMAADISGTVAAQGDLKTLQLESRLQLAQKQIGKAQVHIEGKSNISFSDYQFQSDGDFTGVAWPEARFSVQGKGNHQRVELAQVDIDTLQGKLAGRADVSWRPHLVMNANLSMQDLHTELLAQQWPGRVSGEVSIETDSAVAQRPVHFSLRKVTGELRGFPLQAAIDGVWSEQALKLQKVNMSLAGTLIDAHGTVNDTWDIAFNAHSDKLDSVLDEAKGSFDLRGRISGKRKQPRLQAEGEAAQLAYANNAIKTLQLKLDLGLAKQATASIQLQASDVSSRGEHWDSIQLQTAGTNAAHNIVLDAVNAQASLHMDLHGAFTPWRWDGSVDRLDFKEADYGQWQLQQPASLTVAPAQYRLSSLCLVQNSSRLCGEGQWDARVRKARLDVKAWPLALFNPWLPQRLQLKGQLNAQAEMHTTAKNQLVAKADISSPADTVITFTELNEQLRLGASSLNAVLDEKGLHASLHLPLHDGGGLDNALELPGWSPLNGLPRTQPVHATVKLEHLPAELIARFIPDAGRAQGFVFADLQVNGSLGEPRLRGSTNWRDGSVSIPQLGIQIREVSAEVKSTQTNTVGFDLKARSGDGDVQLSGSLKLAPAQGWPMDARLVSHNLEVSNIPEAYIVIDSDVRMTKQSNSVHIDGDITVPRANLRPQNLPEGAAQVSPDVVIVDSESVSKRQTRWLLSSRLNVKLGDDVRFNGFGIRGKLRGQLVINDEPGKLVLGQGEVGIVDGTYRLRGQDLTIRRGRLLYSNTFIDDPALDVEAVRVVDTVTAGVRLKGMLKQPQLTIFSEPTMSESDALAYLILGHSFSQSTLAEGQSVSNAASALGFVAGDYLAKGVGGRLGLDELRVDVNQTTQNTSLVVGKYLSPKLYLRYYSGIADASRIVQLQYQLSRRVQLQTESGYRGSQSITGGDIFFTIEY
ncbi:MAG: hypothetical protein GC149_16180 [Gammaproteobacteria bacterium]|nr:hypothetical protein [Gammaproteobacteria bacterium]